MVNMVVVIPVYGPVPTPTLYVDPPSIVDTTMTAGSTFSININVKDITDLYGYDFWLNYTTTVLTATKITLGSFFPPEAFIWISPADQIDDTAGCVHYSVTMPPNSPFGKSGSGTLATISFTVDSIGESPLYLIADKRDPPKRQLLDHAARYIVHKEYDGYFTNVLRHTKLYVDPEETINPDLTTDANFEINVNVFNATNLFGYEFFLNYTTAVLTVTNIALGSFFPSDSEILQEVINDAVGYVWYSVTMPSGAPAASGDGTLATISFIVDSIGETPLDLCKTKLQDPVGQSIAHNVYDGYFSNKPIIHDIAITEVKTTVTKIEVAGNFTALRLVEVNEVRAGEKLNITVSVKNNGTIPETFNVTAYYGNSAVSTQNVIALSEGFSKPLAFEWNTEGVAEGNYTIWAEASRVDGETNWDNNKFTMPGEFKVLAKQLLFMELIVVAAIIVPTIFAVAIYFVKVRKPKQV